MLIPRFSLRTLLLIVTGVAFLAFAASQGNQGFTLGVVAASAAIIAVILSAVHAAFFWLLWLASQKMATPLADAYLDKRKTAEICVCRRRPECIGE